MCIVWCLWNKSKSCTLQCEQMDWKRMCEGSSEHTIFWSARVGIRRIASIRTATGCRNWQRGRMSRSRKIPQAPSSSSGTTTCTWSSISCDSDSFSCATWARTAARISPQTWWILRTQLQTHGFHVAKSLEQPKTTASMAPLLTALFDDNIYGTTIFFWSESAILPSLFASRNQHKRDVEKSHDGSRWGNSLN